MGVLQREAGLELADRVVRGDVDGLVQLLLRDNLVLEARHDLVNRGDWVEDALKACIYD